MTKAIKILLFFFVAFAGLFFLYGVVQAIYYSFAKTPTEMPAFLTFSITAIGGVLATNFGAVLGLKIAEGTRFFSFKKTGLMEEQVPSTIQIAATFLYAFVLVGAFIAWLLLKFESNPKLIVLAIPNLSKTLVGVAVGALAVALNVNHKKKK